MQLFRFELPIETVPSLLQSRSEYSSILHWPQDTCDLKSSFSSYIFKPTVGHSLDKELLLLGIFDTGTLAHVLFTSMFVVHVSVDICNDVISFC